MELDVLPKQKTEVGSYFVANYPPFHFWDAGTATHVRELIQRPSPKETPLGVYFHIPFCRKRCHFCYFRVYTDKNATEVQSYLDVLDAQQAENTCWLTTAATGASHVYTEVRSVGALFLLST